MDSATNRSSSVTERLPLTVPPDQHRTHETTSVTRFDLHANTTFPHVSIVPHYSTYISINSHPTCFCASHSCIWTEDKDLDTWQIFRFSINLLFITALCYTVMKKKNAPLSFSNRNSFSLSLLLCSPSKATEHPLVDVTRSQGYSHSYLTVRRPHP